MPLAVTVTLLVLGGTAVLVTACYLIEKSAESEESKKDRP